MHSERSVASYEIMRFLLDILLLPLGSWANQTVHDASQQLMGQTNGFSSCKRPTAHLLRRPAIKVEHFSREKKSGAGNKAVRSLEGKGIFFF